VCVLHFYTDGDSEQEGGGERPSMGEEEIDVILRNKYPDPEEGQATTSSQKYFSKVLCSIGAKET
jgi:hypothetical protein